MNVFLVILGLSVCTYGVMNDKFHSDFPGVFFCFISYSEHLSVIYNNKSYDSLHKFYLYSFIVVQNSRITLDRPHCIAISSKFKMTSLVCLKLAAN